MTVVAAYPPGERQRLLANRHQNGTEDWRESSQSRKWLILLVGGAGFEPATPGL